MNKWRRKHIKEGPYTKPSATTIYRYTNSEVDYTVIAINMAKD